MADIDLTLGQKPFKVGGIWNVYPELLLIVGPNGKKKIGLTVMNLLIFFVRNQGRLINNQELHAEVWRDVVVSESTLRKAISKLKSCFNGNDESAVIIQTIRSKGYIFSTEVSIEYNIRQRKEEIATVHFFVLLILFAIISTGVVFTLNKSEVDKIDVLNITESGIAYAPSLSYDGRIVLYSASLDNLNNTNNSDIFSFDFETGKSENLVHSPYYESDAVLSPNGLKLAYVRFKNNVFEILERDLAESTIRVLFQMNQQPCLQLMDWTLDSEQLLFAFRKNYQSPSSINAVSIKTRDLRQITSPHKNIYGDHNPKLSPDGKKLAFLRYKKESWLYFNIGVGDVYIQNLTNSELKKVTDLEVEISGLDWSQDGESLLYAYKDHNHRFRINEIHPETGTTINHTSTDNVIRNLSVNDKVIFEERHYDYRFMSANIDNPDDVSFDFDLIKKGKIWYPQYSPITNDLIYVSTRTGYPELWLRTSSQNEERQLTKFEGPHVGRSRWSPDNTRIVVPVEDKNNTDLYIIDRQTGAVTPLLLSSFDERTPVWSQSGDNILFSANYNGKYQLWSIAPDKHTEPRLFQDLATDFFLVDNDEIYYSDPVREGIWKVRIGDHQKEQVIKDVIDRDSRNWDIVNGNLFCITGEHWFGTRSLIKIDLTTGNQITLLNALANCSLFYPGITISYDQKKVVGVTYTNTKSEIRYLSGHEYPI